MKLQVFVDSLVCFLSIFGVLFCYSIMSLLFTVITIMMLMIRTMIIWKIRGTKRGAVKMWEEKQKGAEAGGPEGRLTAGAAMATAGHNDRLTEGDTALWLLQSKSYQTHRFAVCFCPSKKQFVHSFWNYLHPPRLPKWLQAEISGLGLQGNRNHLGSES